MRTIIEHRLPKSIVFERRHSCIDAIVFIDDLSAGDYRTYLAESMEQIARTLELTIGISNPHDDLYDIRYLFEQASATLRTAALFPSPENTFFFSDGAFRTMLLSALENTRVDLLYPESLKRLFEHDLESPTSYIQTLEAYLDNNMSVTKTANELFVHRTTLIERLGRIHRILGIDFKDPEQRLFVSLLLKAANFKDTLGKDH